MKIEEKLETAIKGEYDVLVVGGGPAGVSAAVSAGRLGAKTLLIERDGTVGGVSTSGLMSHWTGETKGGIYEEIIARSKDSDDPDEFRYINPEKLKNVYLEMLEEAQVEVLLYTFFARPWIEGQTVKGVIVEGKSGREAYCAKTVIDASGDGDVAYRANVPYIKGRESDGKMQPMTVMFKIGGIEDDRVILPGAFEANWEVPKGRVQDLAKQHLPYPAGHVLLYQTTLPGIVSVNMTNAVNVDGTNSRDLTAATLLCRKQIPLIVDFLREFIPGCENCFVISSAATIGVRETRHFHAAYTLQEEDILAARVFDDWVVQHTYFNFDIHNVDGSGLDENGVQKEFEVKKGYTIPFRCLLPENVEHLLLAGRNIGSTHIAHSNLRAMPICANIGQAAGIAAALAAKEGRNVRQVAPKEIQQAIKEAERNKIQHA